MTKDKIRYMVPRPNKDGTVTWNWQPKSKYRQYGWRTVPLGKDEAIAKQKALQLNADLDAWRAGGGEAPRRADDVGATPPADDDKRRPGTLGLLIRKYEASPKFAAVIPKTQRDYKRYHAILDEWGGTEHVRVITPPRVQTLYQSFRDKTPRKASMLITHLHTILEFGRLEWDDWPHAVNPASNQKLTGGEKGNALIWLPEMVRAFAKKADALGYPSIGTAVLLNEWCGQRPIDVVRFRADVEQQRGWLILKQTKRGARVALPVDLVPHLVARLAEQRRFNQRLAEKFGVDDISLLVCEDTGRAWAVDNLRKKIRLVREALAEDIPTFPHPTEPGEEASTEDLKFGHLRHTAVVRFAESEVDAAGISAITGHTLKSVNDILEHYLIRTIKMAENAFRKRMEAEAKS